MTNLISTRVGGDQAIAETLDRETVLELSRQKQEPSWLRDLAGPEVQGSEPPAPPEPAPMPPSPADSNLPDWLRESVDWTAAHIPTGCMAAFDWRESWSLGPLFAAHANPFDYGDWRYIRSAQDAEEAAVSVAARGFLYGLFGHVHRHRRYDCDAATIFTWLIGMANP